MPELPEVETIVRGLRRRVLGKKLRRFSISDKKRISKPRLSLPLSFVSVGRRGKYIVCETDKGMRCIVHLRMTGELLFDDQASNNNGKDIGKHERARFHFHDGSILRFVDVRRFGTINWLKNKELLPRLGIEPLSSGFNVAFLMAAFKNSSRAIKLALLDQHLVAGIGNIYADESLWLAKIKPLRKAGSLNKTEAARLVAAIKKILREAIKQGGSTLRDYKRVDGSSGGYQESHTVYGREGEKCFRCGVKIKRIKVGGRSSFFCSKCQK
ncbi:MAG: DNA-formamidopyrimidine glycosylase [Patescibacteria group bacterium]|nr:DNA-formamidopyrimidine glycosylase [Patescibacteria group bacterium]MDE2015132.1 DNA-formamidopyrimidine glycosylase [Patescibacteria group bacterium]MDE2226560.1 DNA-formamidopyrimidine glycosylase [Patescibacteria group bacterium]